jgi:hypothetical protein
MPLLQGEAGVSFMRITFAMLCFRNTGAINHGALFFVQNVFDKSNKLVM